MIQGKKKVENYRTHKLISTSEDEWIIIKNNHEPIISKDKFDKVLAEIVLEELNKRFKRNRINTLTRDILLKNIDSIIIFQNGEVNVNLK